MLRALSSWAASLALAGGAWACTQSFDPPVTTTGPDAVGSVATCANVGCAQGSVCYAGDEPAHCGEAGAACTSCAGATPACTAGRCTIEQAVISIGASAVHACVADRTNTLWCWGDNRYGAVGSRGAAFEAPVALSAGEWIEVAAGGRDRNHSCAIHKAGSLWCWGDGSAGQLGLAFAAGETRSVPAPQHVGSDAWLNLAAGDRFSCGVRVDGTLWCWGSAERGRNAADVDVERPTQVGSAVGYQRVAAGEAHACAILEGALECWGDDTYAQLGLSRRPSDGVQRRPGPVFDGERYRLVAAGARHTCGIRDDGTLWCWGDDSEGQAGSAGSSELAVPTQVGSEDGYARVAAGEAHTCATKRDGSLWCWGANAYGQLGGSGASTGVPQRLDERDDWTDVSAGYRYTCAVKRSGALWCWGEVLGVPGATRRPTQVSFLAK